MKKEENMLRQQADELYHNLRLLNLTDDITQKEAILGITTHLTVPGGDYNGLLKYLAWYGEEFLLPTASGLLDYHTVSFSRVVDFGAGLGWLGRGIALRHENIPTLFIDKRQWVLTDIIADLETTNGRERVLDAMQPSDIIVMSELLHCLDNPMKVLKPFEKWPMLVVEYRSWNVNYMKSYTDQIAKFDCTPIGAFVDIFPGRKIHSKTYGPYVIALIQPLGKKE